MQGICGLLKRSADTRPVQIMAWRWLNKMEYNIPDTYGEGDRLGRKKKKWFKNVFRECAYAAGLWPTRLVQ